MDYIFRWANFSFLYFLLPVLLIIIWYKLKYYKPVIYKYSLVEFLDKNGFGASNFHKIVLFLLRLIILLILCFLIAKPQFVNVKSKVELDGIDILLVLDVSGSMLAFDNVEDRRPRIEIAINEAIRFIEKRKNDAIGLVVFGKDAVSRCPLTLDKDILKNIINDLKIGEIDHTETVIAKAIMLASNRLKSSKSKSKIIILLTDGEPTASDMPINLAIDIANKIGVKIYTIGIGSEKGGFYHTPFGISAHPSKLNKELLDNIAQSTGGRFYNAINATDMRDIYNEIDSLEKSKHDSNVFSQYYDFFIPLILVSIFLIFLEIVLKTFVWFSL